MLKGEGLGTRLYLYLFSGLAKASTNVNKHVLNSNQKQLRVLLQSIAIKMCSRSLILCQYFLLLHAVRYTSINAKAMKSLKPGAVLQPTSQ